VNLESTPLIVLAALASLILAAAVWIRPDRRAGLGALAAAMALFGALDVREAFHQPAVKPLMVTRR
jgi:hypothetical protein